MKSPSPKKKQPAGQLELSPSDCQLHIRTLRDDYQTLTRKVIDLREDGGQYFHQEFAENVQSYAKNEQSRTNLALAVPKTLKPSENMVEAVQKEAEEDLVERSPQDPPHTPTSFSFRGERSDP